MNGPHHGAAGRGPKGLTCRLQQPGRQAGMALPDGNGAVLDGNGLCPQVGGKAVLLALPENGGGDSDKMEAAPGNIRRGQHQCPARKDALGPDVSLWERASPVALRVSGAVLEHTGNAVDLQRPRHSVAHTEHAVAALQKGHIAQRTHDIVAKGREGAEPERACCKKAGSVKVQTEPLGAKAVFTDGYLPAVLPESGAGERHAPGGGFGDELDGAGGFAAGPVKGGNDGQSVFFRLALIVPAAKIIVHGCTSRDGIGSAHAAALRGLGSRTDVGYTEGGRKERLCTGTISAAI